MKTLEDIEREVALLAQRISATKEDLPTYGHSRDFGYPHVEVHHQLYHYVVVERGQELEHRSTPNFNELLYWIFSDVTHTLAFTYELHHRIEGQDSRRLAFAKQTELLERLDPQMANRRATEIANLLHNHPYND